MGRNFEEGMGSAGSWVQSSAAGDVRAMENLPRGDQVPLEN